MNIEHAGSVFLPDQVPDERNSPPSFTVAFKSADARAGESQSFGVVKVHTLLDTTLALLPPFMGVARPIFNFVGEGQSSVKLDSNVCTVVDLNASHD